MTEVNLMPENPGKRQGGRVSGIVMTAAGPNATVSFDDPPPPIPSEDREPLRTAIQAVLDARCRCGKVTADEVIDAASFRVAASSPVAPQALDAAYRERNALVAGLIRVGGYKAEVVMAPDTEGWWIVYIDTPAGQLSWHISPDDMDLFSDWPVAFGSHRSPWDGHTTEEKYQRLARLGGTSDD